MNSVMILLSILCIKSDKNFDMIWSIEAALIPLSKIFYRGPLPSNQICTPNSIYFFISSGKILKMS